MEKMYNFLDSKLLPKVTCKSTVSDGYEADNLISGQHIIRSRGFLTYPITKPPVDLEFEFLCPVNIAYIALETTIGKQKCTGIEVFVKTSSSEYISVSRVTYDKDGVIFCDSRKYTKQNPPHFDGNQHLCFFKRDTWKSFTNASNIKITIFRTQRSVPCLASIKVFGTPSSSCSEVTVQTIHKLMGNRPLSALQNSEQNVTSKDDWKVPEDFNDDLTCELMVIPMTLPSGKTIDRDTLEKYIKNEASFGRKPGDPFTGLKFTQTRKPVLNCALKNRIDMFMLLHSNNPNINGLKRTIGTASGPCQQKFRKIECTKTEDCCNCKRNEILYVISCKHIYCRSCLLSLETLCKICNKSFATSEIERYHP